MDKPNLPQVLIISRGLIFHNDKFLFLRREKSDAYRPNEWELPGGKLDDGEKLEENLLRESAEETGLNLLLLKPDIAATNEISNTGKYKGILVITIFGLLKTLSASVKISPEHSEYIWLELKDSDKLNLTEATQTFMKSIQNDPYLIALLKDVNTLSLPNI